MVDLAAAAPTWGIDILLAETLFTYLPVRVRERLDTSWRGGDWIIFLTGAVLGAIFGFAIWLVYRRLPGSSTLTQSREFPAQLKVGKHMGAMELLRPNLQVVVALVVLAVPGTAMVIVFPAFFLHRFFLGLDVAAAVAFIWWRVSLRR